MRGPRSLLFLVVDDDELSRELLAMLLGIEGHRVEVAVSGDDALVRLGAAAGQLPLEPDVILTDMQMPGMVGDQLAVALRTASPLRTRLFAMSGSEPPSAALTGFDGFLLKPFSMGDLNSALKVGQPLLAVAAVPGDTLAQEVHVPPLNELIYRQMAEAMSTVQLGQMYALCLADAQSRIASMTKLAEAGDDIGYRKQAHTVKGGCGMIGAAELFALAQLAEHDGLYAERNDGTISVTVLLSRFRGACDRLERILEKRKST